MATMNEYAQLSSIVYVKKEVNELPAPSGWQTIITEPGSASGFSAGAYMKGNEIVATLLTVVTISSYLLQEPMIRQTR